MMMWTKNAINAPQPDSSSTVQPNDAAGASAAEAVAPTLASDVQRVAPRIIHVHESTPEQIAYKLFEHILELEDVYVTRPSARSIPAHRQYILDTYAQCIRAVRGESSSS
jgi:hypothetical protein